MTGRYDDRSRQDSYRGERGQGRDERGFMDRAGDEVRTWFGDEDAERRRYDEQERQREDMAGRDYNWRSGGSRDWGSGSQSSSASGQRYSGGQSGFGERGWAREARQSEPYRTEHASPTGRHGDIGRYGSDQYGSSGGQYGGNQYGQQDRGNQYGSGGQYAADSLRGGGGYGGAYGSSTQDHGPYGEHSSQSTRPHFAGKGPKGYQRSDARITEDVCDRLADSWDIDASEIEVKVASGEVTLTGTVCDREQKRRAEDLVESLSGVRDVNNQLRVARGDTAASGVGDTAASATTGMGGAAQRPGPTA